MVKQISDNEIYLLIKYIKSVLWRVAKRLSYIEDARYLKVKASTLCNGNMVDSGVGGGEGFVLPLWAAEGRGQEN